MKDRTPYRLCHDNKADKAEKSYVFLMLNIVSVDTLKSLLLIAVLQCADIIPTYSERYDNVIGIIEQTYNFTMNNFILSTVAGIWLQSLSNLSFDYFDCA